MTDASVSLFLADAVRGLTATPKSLPSKYFYDERGSQLFDEICELPEYYPTRCELEIMRRHAGEMAARLGARCLVVEYGAGSGTKTRLLLDRLDAPVGYVPVDISRAHTLAAAAALAADYPGVPVRPVVADFTGPFALPELPEPARRVVYFPGSTLGNFVPAEADALLVRMAATAGRGGGVLVGLDLQKDPAVLEAAYNDARGVTAEFNLNLLTRMNRELGTDFAPERFAHRAFYDRTHHRIEMHLVSRSAQQVRLAGHALEFADGESVRTEYSHKYDADEFARRAARLGLRPQHVWADERRYFAVVLLGVE